MKELADLKQSVANLKAAPIFQKTALAETTLDKAIAVLVAQQARIAKLEEVAHGQA